MVANSAAFSACHSGCSAPLGPPVPCVYLGHETRPAAEDGPATYACQLHGECTLEGYGRGTPSCAGCGQRLPLAAPTLAHRFVDPLRITTAARHPTHALRGMLAGGPAFLVGGGPSLASWPPAALAAPGVWAMGINNAAAMAPVQAFICSDPPGKFHSSIHYNPAVLKFVPTSKLKQHYRVRVRKPDGQFLPGRPLVQCPNTWGYEKRGWFLPDATFFTEPTATLGNFDEGVRRTGGPKGVLTLLAGIRVLYYLGARTIYLVGCDFEMRPEQPYAFGQAKDAGGVASNNERYQLVGQWLRALVPTFRKFGLDIRNTNPDSKLGAFCATTPAAALQHAQATAGTLGPVVLEGWYEK